MSTPPDKTVPSSIEAEEALLGSLMIDPDAIVEVATVVQPDDFYVQRLGWIYEAMRDLHDQRKPVDFLTVSDELERRGKLEDVGGAGYISSLINAVPTAIHAPHYAVIIQRTSTLRRLIEAAGQIARMGYDEKQEVTTVVDQAEKLIFAISERGMQRGLTPIKQIMRSVMDEIDELHRKPGDVHGVPTGFTLLDSLLGGMQKSDLVIVAARPGMGKTSLALTMALNAAKRQPNMGIAIFSLEMSGEQLVQRLLSQETRIDSQRLRLGKVYGDEWGRLAEAAGRLGEYRIYIDDTAALSPFELRTKARHLASREQIGLIIVDYMQLMHGGGRSENRVQEMGLISRALKQLARELNAPLIAISQLSRQVENRADKRPQLSDLRESGSIEQDADVVMFIFREDTYNQDSDRKNIAEIMVAKHRHGPTGAVDLYFNKEFTHFDDLAIVREDMGID